MIFRNTFRLLLANFSNVWKVLVYYIICIALTVFVCWEVASPILDKLSQANVFEDLRVLFENILKNTDSNFAGNVNSFNNIFATAIDVITLNIQFRFNYIFLVVWVFFVFPFTLDLAQLALGEVLYGYMTSQVKYTFTGRYIKNIGKSCVFALTRYFVQLVFNLVIFGLLYFMVKFVTLGSIVYILLDLLLFAFIVCMVAFKHTLFSCWMPDIAVLDTNAFNSLHHNFKSVFKNFFNVYSNCLTLVLCAIVVNFVGFAYTFGVGLIVTLPLTAMCFVVFQMVTYFSCNGMRFYVYPDTFVTPKRFEEKDKIKKLKYLV